MARARFLPLFLAGLSSIAFAQTASAPLPPAGPAGCDSPESHQLDFWVGRWEVHPNGANQIIAHSLIEKKYTGCAIRENWMPLGKEINGGGGSLSLYDTSLKKWRQAWIDSSGGRADFEGGLANGVMSITGNWPNFNGPGKDALVRMNYQKHRTGRFANGESPPPTVAKTGSPASTSSTAMSMNFRLSNSIS